MAASRPNRKTAKGTCQGSCTMEEMKRAPPNPRRIHPHTMLTLAADGIPVIPVPPSWLAPETSNKRPKRTMKRDMD